MKINSADLIEALAFEFGDPERAPEPHHIKYRKGWRPKLNPIQGKAVASSAIYKLYYGERGTGKGHGALHEVLDYLYRNDNCLAYIIVKEMGMGTEGGAWHKLRMDVLPEWQNGLGIEYTEPKLDPQTKKPYIWISNLHGGWSQIMMASLPVASQVEQKVRGREPDVIFVDEAQSLESDTYFTSLLQQLGRRRRSKGQDPAKIIFVCNPEGPSHWLYKRFFEMPLNKDGTWDHRYAKFHIPITDNKDNLPPRYYEDYVLPAVANDPILEARLVRGEWVDRPDGTALFGAEWNEMLHVRGDEARGDGLLPVPGVPIILGYDPGAASTSVHFCQIVPTLDKRFKIVFDELDFVGEYIPYPQLVPLVIERMIYWDKRMETKFHFYHVSDESAFDQFRAQTGGFDQQQFRDISKEYILKNNLDPRYTINMLPCPKGDYSRGARANMIRDDLITQSILISANCRKTRDMFMWLPHDPDDVMAPMKKHRYGHNFDSLSYGFFYFQTSRRKVPGTTGKVQTAYYPIGQA